MVNYYPLVLGFIARLEDNSAESRKRVYENTRIGFLDQMRKHDPPLEEATIAQEQTALEEAIRRVEAEEMARLAGKTRC
jgi:hypothetical protein